MIRAITQNRWLVVLGAILIQLALGAIYAWSVFTDFLKKPPYEFTATQTQIIFSVGLATFAVVMVLAGRWMVRVGPRTVAVSGGICLGLGYIMAGLFGDTFAKQVLFIGLLGGAGIGLAYVTPIAVGMRWYPDKKGLITGLAVAGFGAGALLWVQLAGPWGRLLYDLQIAGLPTVQSVFLLYGILFLIMVLVGAMFMIYPPEGWLPKGFHAAAAAAVSGPARVALDSSEMLRTPQYYMILATFAFSAMAGLMTIGVVKLFGIDALVAGGVSPEEAPPIAATAAGVFLALFNGAGRITWGIASDRVGWRRSAVAMCILQAIAMFAFFWMGQTAALLFLGAALIGFNFGGNFAIFPVATADTFGPKNVGKNYGWVFLAYGLAGIVGPIMAGRFKDLGADKGVDAWLPAFLISGVLCVAAALIVSRVRPPRHAQSA